MEFKIFSFGMRSLTALQKHVFSLVPNETEFEYKKKKKTQPNPISIRSTMIHVDKKYSII